MQDSVARLLRAPPYAARRKELSFGVRTAYAARATGARLSFATVRFAPITVVAHRDKATSLDVRRSYFGPVIPNDRMIGGAAGYRPRVRTAYYMRVYVHSPRQAPNRIGYKGRCGSFQPMGTCHDCFFRVYRSAWGRV